MSMVGIVSRNEPYIEECVLFNHAFGFDQIVVALHNDTYNSEEKIRNLELNNVDVIPFTCREGDGSKWTEFHELGYEIIYNKYKNKVEWMACFDDDEYLWIKDNVHINNLLASVPSDVGQIKIPWVCFGHNNRTISAPLAETRLKWFTKREAVRDIVTCKQFMRMDMIPQDQRWFYSHCGVVNGRTITFDSEEPCNDKEWHLLYPPHSDFENKTVMLAHYRTGAMEDYVKRYKKNPIAHDGTLFDVYRFNQWSQCDNAVEDLRMIQYYPALSTLIQEIINK